MKISMALVASLVSVCFLSSNCDTASLAGNGADSSYYDYDYKKLGYKLFEPDARLMLHYDLEEISGLAYYKPGVLAAVQDESGRLFLIDEEEGKIIDKIRFDTSGDYEGVEIQGNTAFVVESNGDIFKFDITEDKKPDVEKENTVFKSSNDVEGMTIFEGKILIACKASGDIEGNKVKGKAIYQVDIESLKVKKKEWLSFKKDDLDKFIKGRKYFNNVKDFDPSGIAIHPITKDVYIISADRAMIVFDKKHNLKEVVKLDKSIYKQPEGICFTPEGTLYISNEGDGSRGRILKFGYHPQP